LIKPSKFGAFSAWIVDKGSGSNGDRAEEKEWDGKEKDAS
jgi:hypothetical protein